MRMNTEKVPKPSDVDADPARTWGRLPSGDSRTRFNVVRIHRGIGDGMLARGVLWQHGRSCMALGRFQATCRPRGQGGTMREVGEARSTGEAG
jgi:hypothetical protein